MHDLEALIVSTVFLRLSIQLQGDEGILGMSDCREVTPALEILLLRVLPAPLREVVYRNVSVTLKICKK